MKHSLTMKHSLRTGLALFAALALSLPAFAYWTPLQINLAGNAGLPPAADAVYGIRVNALYGSCETVSFIDAGLFNRVTDGVYGIRAGAVNWTEKDAYGITVGAFNVDTHNAGLAAGVLNYAKQGGGVQIGVINIAEEFSGVQIGVLNFHFNSVVPVFPLFNMGSK